MLTRTGYDAVIVCTSNETQAVYWQARLAGSSVVPANCTVLAVDETGRAARATLSAPSTPTRRRAKRLWRRAGRHPRTAAGRDHIRRDVPHGGQDAARPLPGAENNNKPGVKLPALVTMQDGSPPMLMRFSRASPDGCAQRAARRLAFWGDQTFIPSVGVAYTPKLTSIFCASWGPCPAKKPGSATAAEVGPSR